MEPNAKVCRKCGKEYVGKDIPQGDKCPKCGGRLIYAMVEKVGKG